MYCCHLKFCLQYLTSDMVLHIDIDVSYLTKNKVRSRARGHFFLSPASPDPSKPPTAHVPPNGPVHTVCEILCSIMALATEAEIGALFTNTCKGEEL
eukprot:1809984-Ditylum_brightwellii.AAC.1